MMAALRLFVLTRIAPSWLLPMPVRHRLLRWSGVRLADYVYICQGVRFIGPDVSVGRHALINYDAVIDAAWAPVTIGAEVFIAPRVVIMTAGHEIGPATRRAGADIRRAIDIGDGCWLGLGCMVLPGVTIGPGCVIAAGAVVTRDCEPDGVYAGVPARRMRDLDREPGSPPAATQ